MGNCPACLSSELVHNSHEAEGEEEEEIVRVLRTTDNELFEFPGPVFVKDLLYGFQGFAVFPHKAKKKQQPLHPTTQLKFNQIYYLKPWAKPSLLNPLVNYGDNNISLFAKHSSAKPWLPLINPLINTQTELNQPLINPLIINTDHCLNTNDNYLNSTDNYLVNAGDDPLKHVILSSAKPLFNEHLILINTEDRALNEPQGDLLALNDPSENLNTISAQDMRAFNELPEDLVTLNAQERALNELAEGFMKVNAQGRPSPSDVLIQSSSKQGKVMKKVRFAEEVVLIASSNQIVNGGVAAPTSLSICSGSGERNNYSSASNEERTPQFDKKFHCFSASKEGLIPRKEINGVVRLKVVISKKQLTELMSPKASGKESDALMEKMLSPLLSPTSSSHKSDSLNNGAFHSPPWRPSLNHIPEDHSFQESL